MAGDGWLPPVGVVPPSAEDREWYAALAQESFELLALAEAIAPDMPLPGRKSGVECTDPSCRNTVWVASDALWMERERKVGHRCTACLEAREDARAKAKATAVEAAKAAGLPPPETASVTLVPRTPEERAESVAYNLGRVMHYDAIIFARPWTDLAMLARWSSGRLAWELSAWDVNVDQLVRTLGDHETWALIGRERDRLGTTQRIAAVLKAGGDDDGNDTKDTPGTEHAGAAEGGKRPGGIRPAVPPADPRRQRLHGGDPVGGRGGVDGGSRGPDMGGSAPVGHEPGGGSPAPPRVRQRRAGVNNEDDWVF